MGKGPPTVCVSHVADIPASDVLKGLEQFSDIPTEIDDLESWISLRGQCRPLEVINKTDP